MKRICFFIAAILLITLFNTACGDSTQTTINPENQVEEGFADLAETESPIVLPSDLLDGMTPPRDVDANGTPFQQGIFAWKEMIALSWESTYSKENPIRAEPKSSWSYKDGTPSNPMVWETYAHRVEYRALNDSSTRKEFDTPPAYAFGESNNINWNGLNPADYFVVLDEDNEINSCYLVGGKISTDPNIKELDNLVLYMAKENRAIYDYGKHIREVDSLKILKNVSKDTSNLRKNLRDITSQDPCGTGVWKGKAFILPCSDESQEGAIEIKTAWRPMKASDSAKDFLVRNAIYFTEEDEKFTAHEAKYVLIGMHIIQKTTNFPQFFIATWEHNSVESDPYELIIENEQGGEDNPQRRGNIYQVARHEGGDTTFSKDAYTYGALSTAIQEKIRAVATDPEKPHFLANYRLTGYQSTLYPDKTLDERKKAMPAYYLANLVIESDYILANFSGSDQDNGLNDEPNIVTDGQFITTGGCIGCHGVAQYKFGDDMSFVAGNARLVPHPEPSVVSTKTLTDIGFLPRPK